MSGTKTDAIRYSVDDHTTFNTLIRCWRDRISKRKKIRCRYDGKIRLQLASKPRFLGKGLANQSIRICVFVAYTYTAL